MALHAHPSSWRRPRTSLPPFVFAGLTLVVILSGCGSSASPRQDPRLGAGHDSLSATATAVARQRHHSRQLTHDHSAGAASHRNRRAASRRRHHTYRRLRARRRSRSVPRHAVPPLHFHGRSRWVGDLFGIGSYAAQRYPGLAAPTLYRAHLTGADWVREEFTANRIHWGTHAPYQWWRYDRTVNAEKRLGFHILGLLDYNNTFDGNPNSYMPHRQLPRLVQDFTDYVTAMVRHYKHSIQDWQIWNEPDLHQFWGPRSNAADYARLLTAAYEAVKRVQPAATVVLGGPSGADPNGLQFIANVVHAGGRFDVISVQPYRDVPDLELLAEVQRLRRYRKPIWFTEMGWAGESWCMSVCGAEDSQADRLARLYVVSVVGGVQRVFWYDLRNDGSGANFEDHFGLLEGSLAAKPAFIAYQMARFYLNRSQFLGVDVLKPDVFAFELRKRGVTFDVLWNNRLDTYGLDIPWHGRAAARVLDWSGRQVARSGNGQVSVAVSPRSILYIVRSGFLPQLFRPGAVNLSAYRINYPPLRPPSRHYRRHRTYIRPLKRKIHRRRVHTRPRRRRHHVHKAPVKKPRPKPMPTATPTATPTLPAPTPTRTRPKPIPTPSPTATVTTTSTSVP